jgi:ABC-type polysaccharide/polyol phosphate export permease
MRYFVESANTVLFWMVPVVYSFAIIPVSFRPIYQLNPVAALVMAMRDILMEGTRPGAALILKLTGISMFVLALGLVIFRSMKPRFYNHL